MLFHECNSVEPSAFQAFLSLVLFHYFRCQQRVQGHEVDVIYIKI